MVKQPTLTTTAAAPVPDSRNSIAPGPRGLAIKFCTPEGKWDIVGNSSWKS
jgi:catalase